MGIKPRSSGRAVTFLTAEPSLQSDNKFLAKRSESLWRSRAWWHMPTTAHADHRSTQEAENWRSHIWTHPGLFSKNTVSKKENYFERAPILYITKNIHHLWENFKTSAIPRVWEMLITALRGGFTVWDFSKGSKHGCLVKVATEFQ